MHQNRLSIIGGALACTVLLAGCSDLKPKLWPFGGEAPAERSRAPANATEYQCAAGKRFYVRTLEGGAAVWLILPEREVRLNKQGAATDARYSNGIAVLEIAGDEAKLADGPASTFAGCKAVASQK